MGLLRTSMSTQGGSTRATYINKTPLNVDLEPLVAYEEKSKLPLCLINDGNTHPRD